MPDDTLWPLDDHTVGKHTVLRYYLNAWLPILASWNKRILFIDGFAGPGAYIGGEDGSPVIAINTFLEHRARSLLDGTEILFVFIEKRHDRFQHLRGRIDSIRPALPKNVEVQCIEGAFDETMTETLDSLEEQKKQLAPAFVMVDPFGVSDTPMAVIAQILKNPRSEVYISFMWEFINRFKSTKEFPPHLDALFGCPDWRAVEAIDDPNERAHALFDLYARCLKKHAGAKHVVYFLLYKGNVLKYAIFFATKSEKGCDKMKAAIWRIDPIGGYSFRPGTSGEVDDLFGADLVGLQKELQATFGQAGPVEIDKLEAWIMSDATGYHSTHLRKALTALEKAGRLKVKRPGRTGFPSGRTVVEFT